MSGYARHLAASGCLMARKRPNAFAKSFHPTECRYCATSINDLEAKVKEVVAHPAFEGAKEKFDRLPDEVQQTLVREAQGYEEVGNE